MIRKLGKVYNAPCGMIVVSPQHNRAVFRCQGYTFPRVRSVAHDVSQAHHHIPVRAGFFQGRFKGG
jgi:hypothetical protein